MPFASTLRCDASTDRAGLALNVSRLATQALLRELALTPKPGLVDHANSGAHDDMNLATFHASVAAIAPWFARFFQKGIDGAEVAAPTLLRHIRMDGIACERAMLHATGGINTHKGGVFSMGLLCAAAGRLSANGQPLGSARLCAEVASLCDGLVQAELHTPTQAQTAGERLYWRFGLTGARGEAQSGFAIARAHGLRPYLQARARGWSEERALLEALLHLMAHNPDTNLVARGGLAGLALVQTEARRLLACGEVSTPTRKQQLCAFDQLLIHQHLSPGGSADLLAVTCFLASLDDLFGLRDSLDR